MKKSLLKVILISKKNTSLHILQSLNSIIEQTYSPIKILVVDANEPNTTYSLGLREDLVDYPDVDYFQVDNTLSIAQIRNLVLRSAEGEFIAFLNGNDTWYSQKAYLQIEQLNKDSEAGASCSNGVLMDKRKIQISVEPLISNMTDDTSKWVVYNPGKMPAQLIYRTEVLKETGGFDTQFKNFCDGDMLLRLSKEKKILILPDLLCECSIVPDDEYDLNNLRDNQKILYKYRSLFLSNKSMTQIFYKHMMHLAKINYLWLNYLVYVFMYFIKIPKHSILKFRNISQMFKYIFKWFYMMISLIRDYIGIRKDIHRMRLGKPIKLRREHSIKKTDKVEEKPIFLSSAQEYNKKNKLDFSFDKNITSIVIPEYVTVIKKGMFYGCENLISVQIPNTVLEIQSHAFHKCKNLRHVIIQEKSRLDKIGAYAFAGCISLETITLPSGVFQIGRGAFFGCSSLKQICSSYIYSGKEKEVNIQPSAIIKISNYTFAGCSNLLLIEFGDNSMLETIEKGAFMGCTTLSRCLFTGRIRVIENYAFAHCNKLEIAIFTQIDSVRKIGKCAFMGDQSLTFFQFSNRLEYIHSRTFFGCSSLKIVKIPKKVRSISNRAFAKCTSLMKAIIFNEEIVISPTAFEKHTVVQIQEHADNKG